MWPASLAIRLLLAGTLAVAASVSGVRADSPQDKFYRAYYLETEKGDLGAAADLYEAVLADRALPDDLRATAKARLAVCREDLVCADFARLMPPNPLGYVEINRPGACLRGLLEKLGLMAEGPGPAAEGQIAISPAIIDAVLGMRGAAVAITGFDPAQERPMGVAVFHPGDMELIRGLVETALPAAARPVGAIGGHPTFLVEDMVYITLTPRLIIASDQEAEIEAVIYRMKNPHEASLAANPDLADVLREREDAFLYFFVNPKPLMPLLQGAMAVASSQSHELAIAQALLDLRSLRSLTGQMYIGGEGVRLDMTLRLDEGHRNLVYNFLRGPAVDPAVLRSIPGDAAGFLAFALNDAPEKYKQTAAPDTPPIVTFLDLGREVFANVNGVAVFLLPPVEGERPTGEVPDAALALTVNDPAKSEALWGQMLGIASLAAGGVTIDGAEVEIEGTDVRSYRLPEGVSIYFATTGHHLVVSGTRSAMARTLKTLRGGPSIMDDDAFAPTIARIGPHTTLACCAHPRRCVEVARSYMSPADLAEAQPYIDVLEDTVGSLMITHSAEMLRVSLGVSGLPDVSGLVSDLITRERLQGDAVRAIERGDWDEAERVYDKMIAAQPGDLGLLFMRFDLLAKHRHDRAAALVAGEAVYTQMADEPSSLNNFAWSLLTDEDYGHAYTDLALRFAERANELTGEKNWAYVDTLAEAHQQRGDFDQALSLRKQALDLIPANNVSSRTACGSKYVTALLAADRSAEAAAFAEQTVANARKQCGADRARLRDALAPLAKALNEAGLRAPAIPICRELVEIDRDLQGDASVQVASDLNYLGVVQSWAGEVPDAAHSFREALRRYEAASGPNDLNTVIVRRNLAGVLVELDQPVEAEELAREVLRAMGKSSSGPVVATADTSRILGLALLGQGRAAEAEPLLREGVQSLSGMELGDKDRWRLARAESALGQCLSALGRHEEAEPLLLSSYERLQAARGDTFHETQVAAGRLATLYEAWGRSAQSAEWRARTLEHKGLVGAERGAGVSTDLD
ncbi:MAG: tetratricopeptide repeat protein [Phycisphaerae bacterium]|jgi:tetratricopeptide (TPR) repeat protein